MFCNHCGTEVGAEHLFCASCGQAVGPGAARAGIPQLTRLQKHLQLLGTLWIAYSGLKILGALGVFFASHIVFGQIIKSDFPVFLPGPLSSIGGFLLVAAAIGIAAGWGLLQREPWARMLTLVLGFLALLHPILGTALGVYTLWVLLPAESAAEYDQRERRA